MNLLDTGTAYVARFNADGTGEWLALVHGQGPLTHANGFQSQADVVIEARAAADLLGATKMDRPEDVEANPKTNKVYVMLTNNAGRKADQIDAANPRADNRFGHIVEIIPDGDDHAAVKVPVGDPGQMRRSLHCRGRGDVQSEHVQGWLVRHAGQLRRRLDGQALDFHRRQLPQAHRALGRAVGNGDRGRGARNLEAVFSLPHGAEMCGPEFTPDDTTLFLAVQHPGETDEGDPDAEAAKFESPVTRWPDFKDGIPPRPSIVVVTRRGGGKIAT